jgi:hypothetical protein
VWVCGRLLADIVGSNSAGGMDPSLWPALSDVVKWGSLLLADQSARVVPSVVCLECDLETSRTRRPRAQWLSNHESVFPYWEVLCSQISPEICYKVWALFCGFSPFLRADDWKAFLIRARSFHFYFFCN